jgi:hypothetical protein
MADPAYMSFPRSSEIKTGAFFRSIVTILRSRDPLAYVRGNGPAGLASVKFSKTVFMVAPRPHEASQTASPSTRRAAGLDRQVVLLDYVLIPLRDGTPILDQHGRFLADAQHELTPAVAANIRHDRAGLLCLPARWRWDFTAFAGQVLPSGIGQGDGRSIPARGCSR